MESHKDYKIKLIVNDVNLGKAESLRRGLIEAMSDRDNEIIAFTDGDLATPPTRDIEISKPCTDGEETRISGC